MEEKRRSPVTGKIIYRNGPAEKRARGLTALSFWLPTEIVEQAKAKAAERGCSFREWLIEAMVAALKGQ